MQSIYLLENQLYYCYERYETQMFWQYDFRNSFVVKRKVFGIVEFKPIEVKLQINCCYFSF